MLRPRYPIRTDRLVLRPHTADDFAALHALTSNPEVMRYLYGEVQDEAESRVDLAKRIEQHELVEEGRSLVLAVELSDARQVIGQVSLKWTSIVNRQGELGFVFNPAFHGRGYAREAAGQLLRLGFQDLGLHRIKAACDVRNEPSWRLLERLGMRREAHFVQDEIFKGEWSDQYIYAILAREWRAAQTSST